ncbi:hypothetical protein KJ780_02550, partial [Candidatus Micrarchaeota archaeon]|nr:hypothetical protein [Candidatus Micrarchaeota archaeon]
GTGLVVARSKDATITLNEFTSFTGLAIAYYNDTYSYTNRFLNSSVVFANNESENNQFYNNLMNISTVELLLDLSETQAGVFSIGHDIILPAPGPSISGCKTWDGKNVQGGNLWLGEYNQGYSQTCNDTDFDCICDQDYEIDLITQINTSNESAVNDSTAEVLWTLSIIDRNPLALISGSEYEVIQQFLSTKALASKALFDNKSYVAATQDPAQLLQFTVTSSRLQTYNCTAYVNDIIFAPPTPLEINTSEVGSISFNQGEGCYEIYTNCTLLEMINRSSETNYFCVDRTDPTVHLSPQFKRGLKTYNPDNGITINASSFGIELKVSDTPSFVAACILEVNDSSGGRLAYSTFLPQNHGADQYCNFTSGKLPNTSIKFWVHVIDAAGNINSNFQRQITLNYTPVTGCDACESIGSFAQSSILVYQDEVKKEYRVILYSKNQESGARIPVAGAPMLVWLRNSTYKKLYKIVTTPLGEENISSAHFNYGAYDGSAMEYSFIYCCFYDDCGFELCLNATGVDSGYLQGHNIYSIYDVPNAPPDQPEVTMDEEYILPALYKIQVNPPAELEGFARNLCVLVTILFGLLITSLYYTGRNPFGFFDFSHLRPGRHITYAPRGMQVGMKLSGQMVANKIKSAASKVASKYGKHKAAKEEKAGEIMKAAKEGKTDKVMELTGLKDKAEATKAISALTKGSDKEKAATLGALTKSAMGGGFVRLMFRDMRNAIRKPFTNIQPLKSMKDNVTTLFTGKKEVDGKLTGPGRMDAVLAILSPGSVSASDVYKEGAEGVSQGTSKQKFGQQFSEPWLMRMGLAMGGGALSIGEVIKSISIFAKTFKDYKKDGKPILGLFVALFASLGHITGLGKIVQGGRLTAKMLGSSKLELGFDSQRSTLYSAASYKANELEKELNVITGGDRAKTQQLLLGIQSLIAEGKDLKPKELEAKVNDLIKSMSFEPKIVAQILKELKKQGPMGSHQFNENIANALKFNKQGMPHDALKTVLIEHYGKEEAQKILDAITMAFEKQTDNLITSMENQFELVKLDISNLETVLASVPYITTPNTDISLPGSTGFYLDYESYLDARMPNNITTALFGGKED